MRRVLPLPEHHEVGELPAPVAGDEPREPRIGRRRAGDESVEPRADLGGWGGLGRHTRAGEHGRSAQRRAPEKREPPQTSCPGLNRYAAFAAT
jgi:hypothetical protein